MIPLTIDSRETCLNGFESFENVNLDLLRMLLNSKLIKNEPYIKNGEEIPYNETIQLSKYLDLIESKKTVIYNQKLKGYGRVNPYMGLGLFNIRRQIRHTISKDNYKDIDIVNCHPVILHQICIFNKIECSNLEYYIFNRAEVINELSSFYLSESNLNEIQRKDIIKQMIISIMYGAGINKILKDNNVNVPEDQHEFIYNFKNEIKKIQDKIYTNNKSLVQELITSKGNDVNIKGSVMSYYLQECECRILEVIYKYCNSKGINENKNIVLCADGLMIPSDKFYDELIDELEKEILEKTNFNLKLIEKPLDQGYDIEDIKNNKIINIELLTETEESIIKLFIDYTDNFVINKINGYIYHWNGHYWVCDIKEVYINTYLKDQFYKYVYTELNNMRYEINKDHINKKEVKEEKEDKRISKIDKFTKFLTQKCHGVSSAKNLIDGIKVRLTIKSEKIIFDNYKYYLNFENIILDLQTNKLIKQEKQYYITFTTGYEYDFKYKYENINKLNEILNDVINDKDVRKIYLEALGTGLIGFNYEVLIILTGSGGNGKGLLTNIYREAIGQYGEIIPPSLFTSSDNDSKAANPTIFKLHNKRFCITSEPEANCGTLKSANMKRLTGETTLNGRTLYGLDQNINNTSTYFMEANDVPKIDHQGDAENRRIIIIPFKAKYVSIDDFNNLTDDVKQLKNIKLKKTEYKDKDFVLKHRQAFIEIIRPLIYEFINNNNSQFSKMTNEMKEIKREYFLSSSTISTWFYENYKLDKSNTTSYIKIIDIHEKLTNSDIYKDLTKKERLKYTQKALKDFFNKDTVLSIYTRPRDSYFNKQIIKTDYIVQHVEIKDEYEEYNDEKIDNTNTNTNSNLDVELNNEIIQSYNVLTDKLQPEQFNVIKKYSKFNRDHEKITKRFNEVISEINIDELNKTRLTNLNNLKIQLNKY